MPPDVGQEELQAVGGAGEHMILRLYLGCALGLSLELLVDDFGLADLEADALQLARQILDLLFVQLMLERERLELCCLEVAPLFGALDDQARLVRLKQVVKLILGQ